MSVSPPPAEPEINQSVLRLQQRLRALRGRYPGLMVATNVTHIHEDQVVVRAALTLPDGTSISAHAAEPSNAGLLDEAIEQAEWRSLARALDLLGVGDVPASTRRPEPVLEEPAPAMQTVERLPEDSTPSVVEALRRGVRRGPDPADESVSEPVTAAANSAPSPRANAEETAPKHREQSEVTVRPRQTPAEEPELPRRAPIVTAPSRPVEVAEPAQEAVTEPEPETSEPNMADFSWTNFWTWARTHNLSAKGQVEQRIGRSIDGLTPAEVRQLLHDAGVPLS